MFNSDDKTKDVISKVTKFLADRNFSGIENAERWEGDGVHQIWCVEGKGKGPGQGWSLEVNGCDNRFYPSGVTFTNIGESQDDQIVVKSWTELGDLIAKYSLGIRPMKPIKMNGATGHRMHVVLHASGNSRISNIRIGNAAIHDQRGRHVSITSENGCDISNVVIEPAQPAQPMQPVYHQRRPWSFGFTVFVAIILPILLTVFGALLNRYL